MGGLNPNLMIKGRAMAGPKRLCPIARHALGVAPPRAVRARLVMRLSTLHRREEARLVAAARDYRTKAVRGPCAAPTWRGEGRGRHGARVLGPGHHASSGSSQQWS
jgi:hypothetical protein